MAMAVEAKSLSSVLQTAADPPADPTIPLPNVSEPLALYIVKVPGSKDVFLTPVKPRDKIITAEDIRSSIYFLHVHTPEDDEIIKTASPTSKTEKPKVDAVPPPPPVHKTTPTTSQQQRVIPTVLATSKATATSDVKTLSRINHPLPVLPVDKDNQWPSLLRPGPGMTRAQRPPALAINRRPVNQSILSPSPQSALQNQHNIQQGRRKPGAPGRGIPFSPPYPEIDVFPSAASFLSPKRETHTIHEGQEVTIPQVFELPANEMKSLELPAIETTTQLSNINQQPSYSAPFSSGGLLSPPIQDSQRVSSTFESMVSSAPTSGKPATSFIETPPPTSTRTPASEIKEYQFTLIRRDPVTGKQSNVATIYNHASQTRLNEDQFTFETTPNWMNIVLENPGYEKFNKSHALTSPTHSCADLLSPMMSAVGACSHDSGHRKFHRHLQIEFSKLSSRPAKYSKVLSQDRLDFPENSGVYGRESGDFAASQMSLMSGNHQLHGRRHKSTGFAFRSPWDGRCEFTSATGHSTLRCKHAMASSLLSLDGPANQISELRHNLPSMPPAINTKVKPVTPNESVNSLSSKRDSKLLGRFKNRFSRSTSSLGVFKRDARFSSSTLDMSLGQERAGGGFTGTHSKLGKLIIENEGLMMMDLLVAANMSVWWKSYEKR